jgi:hypothetical protein
LMPHLRKINEVLDNCVNGSLIDEESRKRVLEISSPIKL